MYSECFSSSVLGMNDCTGEVLTESGTTHNGYSVIEGSLREMLRLGLAEFTLSADKLTVWYRDKVPSKTIVSVSCQ